MTETGVLLKKEVAVESWETMRDQAEVVQKSGLAPKSLNTPEKVLVVAMKGRELDMGMMHSLSHIHVIEGRPTLSAEAMLALVQRDGHIVRIVETTSEKCTVVGIRKNDPSHETRIEWTMDDAKAAGVAGKNTWKNYPRAMLRSRAVSELCRAMFADTLSGASYAPEELGALVNEDGEVVGSPATDPETDEPEDVEEAEVVEEDHSDLLEEVTRRHRALPEAIRPDGEKMLNFAGESVENARRAITRLEQIEEEGIPA